MSQFEVLVCHGVWFLFPFSDELLTKFHSDLTFDDKTQNEVTRLSNATEINTLIFQTQQDFFAQYVINTTRPNTPPLTKNTVLSVN